MSIETGANLRREQKDRIDKELDVLDDELITGKYKVKFLGLGGEHMVFSIESHPNIVAKVDYQKLKKIIELHNQTDTPLDSISDEFKARVNEFIEEDRTRTAELKKFFPGATLKERVYLQTVPVTKQLLAEALTDQDPVVQGFDEGIHNIVTIVRIQEKAPDSAVDERALSIAFSYVEQDQSFDRDVYKEANKVLIDGEGTVEEKLFRAVLNQNGIDLLDRMNKDKDLSLVVKKIVEQAIAYITQTGAGLDLAGEHNVSVYKEAKKWKYLLLDAKYGSNLIEQAKQVLNKINHDQKIEHNEANQLMNALNMIRLINGLAALTGSEKRLDIFNEPIEDLSEKIFSAITSHYKKEVS